MYRILGSDGKEYGPVPPQQVGQWIAENRLNGDTRVCGDDGQWRPLRDVPDLAVFLQPHTGVPPLPASTIEARWLPSDFDGDYDLDIGACLGSAWKSWKEHTSVVFLASILYLGAVFLLGVLGALPLVGIVFSLFSAVIGGPLIGGLYHFYLRVIRRENPPWDALFDGIRKSFLPLFLGQIVSGILVFVPLIPGFIVLMIGIAPRLMKVEKGPSTDWLEFGLLLPGLGLLGIALPVAVYLQTSWMFLLPLILDHRVDFWTAMGRSRRQVSRHWWPCFALIVVLGILNLLGAMACLVGVLFTFPITNLAFMHAYETVIHGRKAE